MTSLEIAELRTTADEMEIRDSPNSPIGEFLLSPNR